MNTQEDHSVNSEGNTGSSTDDTNTPMEPKNKKSINPIFYVLGILGVVGAGILVVTGIILGVYFFWPEEDPFRKREGEQQIFVSALNLREYPDDDAYKIGSFSTGTRFIYDTEEEPIYNSNFYMEKSERTSSGLWLGVRRRAEPIYWLDGNCELWNSVGR